MSGTAGGRAGHTRSTVRTGRHHDQDRSNRDLMVRQGASRGPSPTRGDMPPMA
ncbi:hypothetical protein GZL_01736 [Streptomyces sp. 769]|nr:hypothetical protein GZL_01736 [Streptomyces sp. 769]